MSFDSEIENTLIEEINHYNRSTVEAHNQTCDADDETLSRIERKA